MNTPLTDVQRELLSAWLDGETTAAEKAEVEALLKREDAREYLETLRETAALVAAHAPVRAPVGLSGRVMGALEGEFKPKAFDPGSQPFGTVPTLSWRAPLYAAAAAIVVSLAIMFGPELVSPADGPATGVARYVPDEPSGDERGASTGTVTEKPEGTRSESDRELNSLSDHSGDEAFRRAGAEAQEALKSGKVDNWAGDAGKVPGEALADELEKRNRKLEADPSKEADVQEPRPAPSPKKGESVDGEPSHDAKSKKFAEEKGPGDEANDDGGVAGGGGTRGGRSDKGAVEDERRNERDEQEREQDAGETKKSDQGADEDKKDAPVTRRVAGKNSAEPKPASPAESGAAPEEPLSISITEAGTIGAQTDVLWISSLYGKAALTEEDADLESVTVELAADKLPELLAALKKLAREQGYGEVESAEGATAAELANRAKDQGQGIQGYLPDEEETETPPANDPANPPEGAAEAEAPAKVKVVIRLK